MSSTPSIQIFGCVGSTADLIAQSLTQPAAPAPVLQAAPAPWPVLGLKHTIYDPVTDIRSCTSDFTADIPVARTRGLLPPQLEAEYQIERFCCYQKDYEPWHSVRVASGQTFEAYVGHLRQDPNQKVFIKHCNPGSNIQVQQEVEQILKYPDQPPARLNYNEQLHAPLLLPQLCSLQQPPVLSISMCRLQIVFIFAGVV